jgi:hypothetical protein
MTTYEFDPGQQDISFCVGTPTKTFLVLAGNEADYYEWLTTHRLDYVSDKYSTIFRYCRSKADLLSFNEKEVTLIILDGAEYSPVFDSGRLTSSGNRVDLPYITTVSIKNLTEYGKTRKTEGLGNN